MDIKRKLFETIMLGLLLVASIAHAQRQPGTGGGMGRGGPHQGMGLGPGPGGGQAMMMAPGSIPASAPEGDRRLNWVNERSDDSTPRQRPRMSREERQELRRDIHDAGRDLYPRRRPH